MLSERLARSTTPMPAGAARLQCALVLHCARVPVYLLTDDLVFPPPEGASPEGVVAVGGDTSPERLVLAYSQGIFPWPHHDLPLLWFSPDPRFVISFPRVHIGRSLRKSIRAGRFEIRSDTAFERVLAGCASAPRPGQDGTWITEQIEQGFGALHRLGLAHSIEAWRDGELVGGLYGIALGKSFCGESMFSLADDASKVATVAMLGNLCHWGFHFVDCQVYTEHLARFGAERWPRRRFLAALRNAVAEPTRRGPWQLELDPAQSVLALEQAKGERQRG
jgi:leucyl/phenylalanyl-tRNA--protein transferase